MENCAEGSQVKEKCEACLNDLIPSMSGLLCLNKIDNCNAVESENVCGDCSNSYLLQEGSCFLKI